MAEMNTRIWKAHEELHFVSDRGELSNLVLPDLLP